MEEQAQVKIGLARLLDPFHEKEISWKPKPTKAQTAEVKQDFKKGCRCQYCGGWHHPQAVHLAYVGHAATTRRILEVDPEWDWDFLHADEKGFPVYDSNGGMWITLTILGVTRKGYGDAEGKQGPNAVKELIGDAIRNAAMRFGVALELWHKGEFAKPVDSDDDKQPDDDGDIEFYSDEDFEKKFPVWKEKIELGKNTPKGTIEWLANNGVNLTSEQIKTINNIKVK